MDSLVEAQAASMMISQQLESLILLGLDNPRDKCYEQSTTLLDCMTSAGKNHQETKLCILCPVANTKKSRATTCLGFEREGFCENCEGCEHLDCPAVCWPDFEVWLRCTLSKIGCDDICLDWLKPPSGYSIA